MRRVPVYGLCRAAAVLAWWAVSVASGSWYVGGAAGIAYALAAMATDEVEVRRLLADPPLIATVQKRPDGRPRPCLRAATMADLRRAAALRLLLVAGVLHALAPIFSSTSRLPFVLASALSICLAMLAAWLSRRRARAERVWY